MVEAMNGCRFALVTIGVLLCAAASLKAAGLIALSPIASQGLLGTPAIQVALVYTEFLIGGWLLLGRPFGHKWLVAVLLFGCFAGVNLFQAMEGQSSCGCFGPIRVNPWIVFWIDLGVLGALAFCRPREELAINWRSLGRIATTGVAHAAVVIVVLLALAWSFGSTQNAIAWLRQQPYSLTPQVVDFGSAQPGVIKEARIEMRNWSNRPIRIVGGTSSCSFVATRDLPVTVMPGEQAEILLVAQFPPTAGRFDQHGQFWVDTGALTVEIFGVTGVVSHDAR